MTMPRLRISKKTNQKASKGILPSAMGVNISRWMKSDDSGNKRLNPKSAIRLGFMICNLSGRKVLMGLALYRGLVMPCHITMPHFRVVASRRVDLPEPFSPTKKVTAELKLTLSVSRKRSNYI